jgi:hypothetical protein
MPTKVKKNCKAKRPVRQTGQSESPKGKMQVNRENKSNKGSLKVKGKPKENISHKFLFRMIEGEVKLIIVFFFGGGEGSKCEVTARSRTSTLNNDSSRLNGPLKWGLRM